jgi:hypothetical protein
VPLREDVESVLLAWDRLETGRGQAPVIDFDCHPDPGEVAPADSRLAVLRRLEELAGRATGAEYTHLASRIGADLAYLRSLLGQRWSLQAYVLATQGCRAAGWPAEYVVEIGERARTALARRGIGWGPDTAAELDEAEGALTFDDAADAIRQAASDLEPALRLATGATADYQLVIESADVDAYWAYWVDGAGQRVRLRLNRRTAKFTEVRAGQFALHEVLGHGVQAASFTVRASDDDVPWVRMLSVHTQSQVLLEGLAQTLPVFVTPDDEDLVTRVRLDHYLQVVRAELHLAINARVPIGECADHARTRVPFWTESTIGDTLTDRGNDPMLRSYLWAYPAGIDWFTNLARADATMSREVLHAAYRDPLTPADLAALWPQGPPVGGPGGTVRLWKPALP